MIYVRVSKQRGDQNPETQAHLLRGWCLARGWTIAAVCSDRITGDPARRGRTDPPGLVRALGMLARKEADVLAVFAADRLTRGGIVELLQLLRRIVAMGAHLASYREGAALDTTNPYGELVVSVLGWMAQMELSLNRERTVAGLDRARARGVRLGRPEKPLPDLSQVAELLKAGKGHRAIGEQLRCGPWLARRAIRELRAQNPPQPPG
ncbi:MAG: recombinase family protein [Polyangia bacterium]